MFVFWFLFGMARGEEDRILQLLESVEKEELRAEERTENPGAIRRTLFVDEQIEAIDDVASDDDQEDNLEEQVEDTESEQSGDEEDIVTLQGP